MGVNRCSCQDGVEIYYGSTPKYKLEINADVPMSGFNFEVKLCLGEKSVTIQKSDMRPASDGTYYLTFDTKDLGIGSVKTIVTAYIPDGDYTGGIRTEVCVVNRPIIIKRP